MISLFIEQVVLNRNFLYLKKYVWNTLDRFREQRHGISDWSFVQFSFRLALGWFRFLCDQDGSSCEHHPSLFRRKVTIISYYLSKDMTIACTCLPLPLSLSLSSLITFSLSSLISLPLFPHLTLSLPLSLSLSLSLLAVISPWERARCKLKALDHSPQTKALLTR